MRLPCYGPVHYLRTIFGSHFINTLILSTSFIALSRVIQHLQIFANADLSDEFTLGATVSSKTIHLTADSISRRYSIARLSGPVSCWVELISKAQCCLFYVPKHTWSTGAAPFHSAVSQLIMSKGQGGARASPMLHHTSRPRRRQVWCVVRSDGFRTPARCRTSAS